MALADLEKFLASPPPAPTWGQRVMSGYKAVSDPVTDAVAKFGVHSAPGQIGMGLAKLIHQGVNSIRPGTLPELPSEPEILKGARSGAEFIVPQTPAELGMALIGPVGRGVGVAMAPTRRVLAPMLGAAAGGALGGGAGAAVSGQDVLPAAATGLVGGAGGEALGQVYGAVARGLNKAKIAHGNADRMMETLGDLSGGLKNPPGLEGRTGSERLRDMVGAANKGMARGPGKEGLGRAKEAAMQAIEAELGGAPINVPYLSPGVPGQAPDGTRIVVKATYPVSLRQANDELTAIGEGLRHREVWDPTIREQMIAEEYGKLSGDIRRGLEAAKAGLGGAWDEMQRAYRVGLGGLEMIRDAAGVFQPSTRGLLYDQGVLQKKLVSPKVEDDLAARMSPEEIASIIDTLSRGAGLGFADRIERGPGGLGQAGLEWFRGRNSGSMGPVLGAIRSVVPGIGDQYVGQMGRIPYELPPVPQNLLDYLTERGLGSLVEQLP